MAAREHTDLKSHTDWFMLLGNLYLLSHGNGHGGARSIHDLPPPRSVPRSDGFEYETSLHLCCSVRSSVRQASWRRTHSATVATSYLNSRFLGPKDPVGAHMSPFGA